MQTTRTGLIYTTGRIQRRCMLVQETTCQKDVECQREDSSCNHVQTKTRMKQATMNRLLHKHDASKHRRSHDGDTCREMQTACTFDSRGRYRVIRLMSGVLRVCSASLPPTPDPSLSQVNSSVHAKVRKLPSELACCGQSDAPISPGVVLLPESFCICARESPAAPCSHLRS